MDFNGNELHPYECLFNWRIVDFMQEYEYLPDAHNDDNHIFIFTLWSILMKLCQDVVNKDNVTFNKDLHKLQHMLSDIKNQNLDKERISSKVIIQVVNATIYYALMEMKRPAEAENIRKTLQVIDLQDTFENSTLLGLKSLSWNLFYTDRRDCEMKISENATSYALRARNENKCCALWYYIYGCNARVIRLNQGLNEPTFSESRNFAEAYKINASPFYGIQLARCYEESHQKKEALNLYRNLKNSREIDDLHIYLRLAYAFINFHDLVSAKECLNKAESLMINVSDTFLHCYGLYLMFLGHYEKAAECLKQSSEMGNIKGDIHYLTCLHILNPKTNLETLLKALISKYSSPYIQMQVKLHIAMLYFKRELFSKALIAFEDAIKINPKSTMLDKFVWFYNNIEQIKTNIPNFIKEKVLPDVNHVIPSMSGEAVEAYNYLKDLVDFKDKFDEDTENGEC